MSNKIQKTSLDESLGKLAEQSVQTLKALDILNESVTTDHDYVQTTLLTDEGEKSFVIPSYRKVLTEMSALRTTVNSFITGSGLVKTSDGTERLISVSPIPVTPNKITAINTPTHFTTDSNWFFEDLMFPRIKVTLNLTGKIEASSDRVRVNRVILDSTVEGNMLFYKDHILNKERLPYHELITLLNKHNIKYYEDEEDCRLPLTQERFSGSFFIKDIKIISAQEWYFFDTLKYYNNSLSGMQGGSLDLNKGDILKYNETLYKVEEVISEESRVRLTPYLGFNKPMMESVLTLYNEPFSVKEAKVSVGFNEINIIFVKGVNENFNLLATDWSNPVHFVTNELIYDGNETINLGEFYHKYVADFGKKMIAEVKDRKIYAYNGVTPNKPTIQSSYFSVVQINTQLNNILNSEDIKSTASKIETIKSNIASINQTISAQKEDLQATSDKVKYQNIQSQINANTKRLKQLQTEHRTSLKYLQDIVANNGVVNVRPKYRVRGFFPIPAPKFIDQEKKLVPQQIIGFDVSYRYLKLDNTGTDLKTFKYTVDGVEHSGVYSDWNVMPSTHLVKSWDSTEDAFKWKNESITDGSIININQVDIPIQKGEKVELRIRSISEAGYPENPLKSEWSDSVIVDFPSNLSQSNQIENLLNDAWNERTELSVNETLDALGVAPHLDDQFVNTEANKEKLYKHKAGNISYEMTDGRNGTKICSLQDHVHQHTEDNVFDEKDPNIILYKHSAKNIFFDYVLDGTQYRTSVHEFLTKVTKGVLDLYNGTELSQAFAKGIYTNVRDSIMKSLTEITYKNKHNEDETRRILDVDKYNQYMDNLINRLQGTPPIGSTTPSTEQQAPKAPLVEDLKNSSQSLDGSTSTHTPSTSSGDTPLGSSQKKKPTTQQTFGIGSNPSTFISKGFYLFNEWLNTEYNPKDTTTDLYMVRLVDPLNKSSDRVVIQYKFFVNKNNKKMMDVIRKKSEYAYDLNIGAGKRGFAINVSYTGIGKTPIYKTFSETRVKMDSYPQDPALEYDETFPACPIKSYSILPPEDGFITFSEKYLMATFQHKGHAFYDAGGCAFCHYIERPEDYKIEVTDPETGEFINITELPNIPSDLQGFEDIDSVLKGNSSYNSIRHSLYNFGQSTHMMPVFQKLDNLYPELKNTELYKSTNFDIIKYVEKNRNLPGAPTLGYFLMDIEKDLLPTASNVESYHVLYDVKVVKEENFVKGSNNVIGGKRRWLMYRFWMNPNHTLYNTSTKPKFTQIDLADPSTKSKLDQISTSAFEDACMATGKTNHSKTYYMDRGVSRDKVLIGSRIMFVPMGGKDGYKLLENNSCKSCDDKFHAGAFSAITTPQQHPLTYFSYKTDNENPNSTIVDLDFNKTPVMFIPVVEDLQVSFGFKDPTDMKKSRSGKNSDSTNCGYCLYEMKEEDIYFEWILKGDIDDGRKKGRGITDDIEYRTSNLSFYDIGKKKPKPKYVSQTTEFLKKYKPNPSQWTLHRHLDGNQFIQTHKGDWYAFLAPDYENCIKKMPFDQDRTLAPDTFTGTMSLNGSRGSVPSEYYQWHGLGGGIGSVRVNPYLRSNISALGSSTTPYAYYTMTSSGDYWKIQLIINPNNPTIMKTFGTNLDLLHIYWGADPKQVIGPSSGSKKDDSFGEVVNVFDRSIDPATNCFANMNDIVRYTVEWRDEPVPFSMGHGTIRKDRRGFYEKKVVEFYYPKVLSYSPVYQNQVGTYKHGGLCKYNITESNFVVYLKLEGFVDFPPSAPNTGILKATKTSTSVSVSE